MPTRGTFSPVAVAVAVTVLVALALVTLLGGWDRSRPEGPVRVSAGVEVEAAPFRVRLDEASARYERVGDEAEEGQAFLLVDGWLELAGDEPVSSSTLTQAFTADLESSFDEYGAPADEPQPGIRVRADGSGLRGLGPGLRYDVQLVFVVDEASVPDRVTVTVREHTRRPSALDGDLGWYDAAPAARVTLDVAPLPAVRPEPEAF